MAIKELTYSDEHGQPRILPHVTHGTVYALTAKREKFAQLCAQSIEPQAAYCDSHDVRLGPETASDIKDAVRALLRDTTVILRIQELKRPVLRKLHRKIEYGLHKALEQCQVAWDLAYANGDVKGMLAAVRMQAELSKLLSQDINVNHRHGVLDEASTDVLLAMKKEYELRLAKQKKLTVVGEIVTVNPVEVGEAALGSTHRVPSEAVPNSEGQDFF